MWGWIIGGFFVITWVPAIVEAVFQFSQPKVRGAAGETAVDNKLRKFKGRGFARANDIMLPLRDKTSQIDNLLISRYGIFVIESKNYSGIVEGKEHSPRWTQILPGRGQKPREFPNPIWQNEGHIRALKQLLRKSYPKLQYHNMVVFPDRCAYPNIPGVVSVSNLNKFIKSEMQGEPLLSENDVAAIKELIEQNNIKDRKRRAEHISYAHDSANMAKEKERRELVRQRAEKNNGLAAEVQRVYSSGMEGLERCQFSDSTLPDDKPTLDMQITSASYASKIHSNVTVPEKESVYEL